MNSCVQFLLGTNFGKALVGSGWLGVLASAGYMIQDHQITVTSIHSLISSLTPVITALAAGGGVHFIYNRTNGHSASVSAAPAQPSGGTN